MPNRVTKIENAKITGTMLGYQDHGILTCMINIEGDGWGGGFGGVALDQYDPEKCERVVSARAMGTIPTILKILEKDKWEDLPGTFVRVETEGWGGSIVRIGHLLKDQWFSFRDYLDYLAQEGDD